MRIEVEPLPVKHKTECWTSSSTSRLYLYLYGPLEQFLKYLMNN